jgi:hypothetical protein
MAMLLSVGAMPRQAQAASGFGGWGDYDGYDKHDHRHEKKHGQGWSD